MASTRINNDNFRVEENLLMSTGQSRYILNVPGNGMNNSYINDPNIRLQYWGANILNNGIDLENKLYNIGLTNNNRNNLDISYNNVVGHSRRDYDTNNNKITTHERILSPAWNLKDTESNYLSSLININHKPFIYDDNMFTQEYTRDSEFDKRNV
jgi:hypothetical protein